MPLSEYDNEKDREKERNKRWAMEKKYEIISDDLLAKLDIQINFFLFPPERITMKGSLTVLAAQLHEIAEEAERLAEEFE